MKILTPQIVLLTPQMKIFSLQIALLTPQISLLTPQMKIFNL
jgi:hypothetical protein